MRSIKRMIRPVAYTMAFLLLYVAWLCVGAVYLAVAPAKALLWDTIEDLMRQGASNGH